jgi:hypothetical protein
MIHSNWGTARHGTRAGPVGHQVGPDQVRTHGGNAVPSDWQGPYDMGSRVMSPILSWYRYDMQTVWFI